MKKTVHYWVRKSHRYLGLFTAAQFLMWTIGGLYFSWTNLDDIHGDQFHKEVMPQTISSDLLANIKDSTLQIERIRLRFIEHQPHFWINDEQLIDAKTGETRRGITEKEALGIAQMHLIDDLKVKRIERIEEVGKHHEYRERPLPAYVISYEGNDNVKAYISIADGGFQRVRHHSWRNFDFLWMMHTMDYQGRDNFNNWLLRIFSVVGLVTIILGMTLFFYSSNTIRKWWKQKKL